MSVANILTTAGLIQGHFLDTASAPLNALVPISQNGATSVTSGSSITLTAGAGIVLNGAVSQEALSIVTAGSAVDITKQMLMSEGSFVCIDNRGATKKVTVILPVDMPIGYVVTVTRLDGSGQNDLINCPAGYVFSTGDGSTFPASIDMDSTGTTLNLAGAKRSLCFAVTPFTTGGNKILQLMYATNA